MSFLSSCVIMDFLCGLHLLQLGTDSAVGVGGPFFFPPSLPRSPPPSLVPSYPPSLFTVPSPLCLFLIFLLMPRLECPWLRPVELRPSLQVKTHARTSLTDLCLHAPQVDWLPSDQLLVFHEPTYHHHHLKQPICRKHNDFFVLDRFSNPFSWCPPLQSRHWAAPGGGTGTFIAPRCH